MNLVLYFDNSVLSAIEEQDAGGRIKALLKRHGSVALGSIQNLTELLRIPSDDLRSRSIRTLLQVGRTRETVPVAYRQALALVGQLRQHHPDWLNENPDLTAINADLYWHRIVWERVRQNPLHRPSGLINNKAFIESTVGRAVASGKHRRQTRLRGEPPPDLIVDDALRVRLKLALDRLPPLEAYWRQQVGTIWWRAIAEGDVMVISLRDWLLPYLNMNQFNLEEWLLFWIVDVDAARLAVSRVQALTEFFQAERPITAGNAGDINHSAYAVSVDYLLTADKNFHHALSKVAEQPNTRIGRPLLLRRKPPDIVEEVEKAMAW